MMDNVKDLMGAGDGVASLMITLISKTEVMA